MELNDHQHDAVDNIARHRLSSDALTLLSTLIDLADAHGFVQIGNTRLDAACTNTAGRRLGSLRGTSDELERAGLLLRLTFCIDPDRSYYGPSVWLLRLPNEEARP